MLIYIIRSKLDWDNHCVIIHAEEMVGTKKSKTLVIYPVQMLL